MKVRVFIIQLLFMLCFIPACVEVNNSSEKKSSKPVIDHFTAVPTSIMVGDSSVITVDARDLNDEQLSYVWTKPDGGDWLGLITGESVKWKAPSTISPLTTKNFRIIVKVQNEHSKYVLDTVTIVVNQSYNPIVTFQSPQNGEYIPLSRGIINIQATSSYPSDTYSMKCFINGVYFDSTTNGTFNKNWNIISESEGPKQIHIIATRAGGYTGSSTINVSLEGTIGKRKN